MINKIKDKSQINSAGFTITELLVVIFIISLLSLALFANYRAGEKHYALQRSAHKLAQDIRRTQEMAMAARDIDGHIVHGLRFFLNRNNYYRISCDMDDDCEDREELQLERSIFIESIIPSGPLTVKFVPPNPDVIFEPDSNEVSITINYDGGPGRTVRINKAGLIEVE